MLRAVLDVLFPKRCAGCGDGPWPFCPPCRRGLITLTPPWCRRCGRPSEEDLTRCRECPPRSIDSARAPFLYAGPARAALLRLKFSGWRAVARALGGAMAAVSDLPAEAVTWVPLAGARRAGRGYDQGRALAEAAGASLGLPVIPLLERVRDTPPQAGRPAPERRRSMRGAFRAVRAPPSLVVLVDDVLTTGATAAECATTLLSAGARRVALLAAARAISGSLPARCYTRADSRLSLWLPGGDPGSRCQSQAKRPT